MATLRLKSVSTREPCSVSPRPWRTARSPSSPASRARPSEGGRKSAAATGDAGTPFRRGESAMTNEHPSHLWGTFHWCNRSAPALQFNRIWATFLAIFCPLRKLTVWVFQFVYTGILFNLTSGNYFLIWLNCPLVLSCIVPQCKRPPAGLDRPDSPLLLKEAEGRDGDGRAGGRGPWQEGEWRERKCLRYMNKLTWTALSILQRIHP